MVALLKRKLSAYKPSKLRREERMCASVLIPIFENSTGHHVVLTKRTTTVKYHKGEISFPGGMYEKDDGDTLKTAIRECGEEIGVKGGDIEIVGRLDDMSTFTGFVITPYVGLIPYPYAFKLNPGEVAYLIYLPVPYLLKSELQIETVEFQGELVKAPAIYYEGERIWGATCRILMQLRKIIEDETIQS
jgi:8-oxo-dGTP pyrophosphatase MutT (NUDIX family)